MFDAYHMAYINLAISLLVGILVYGYQFIYPKKPLNLFYLLIIISFLPLVSIFRSGVPESGDFTIHTKFAMQFFQNLQEGNIIPRWVPDHCGGYGCPVYMFLYPLPYYLISFLHIVGFSFITSMKLFLTISFILSGIGMFLWIKKEMNEKAGFMAAVFYLFAPYHLIDLHFRSSVGELLSITILPFIFYFSKRLIEEGKTNYFIAVSLLVSLLILSHQATSVISLPLFVFYGLYTWKQKKIQFTNNFSQFVFSIVIGIGLSSFYWLPILTEGKYIQFVREASFEFNHLRNFFISPGRLGLLFQGMFGQLYFTIGYTQWLILALSVYLLLKKRINKKLKYLLIGCLLLSIIFFGLMQEFTLPVWKSIPFLNNFIYTWRLFIELIILISVIAAIVVTSFKNSKFLMFICILSIMYTLLNWSTRKMLPQVTDSDLRNQVIFTEKVGELEITTPIWVNDQKVWVGTKPSAPIESNIPGTEIVPLLRKTSIHEYAISAQNETIIKENTFYFPGWKVFSNHTEIPLYYNDSQYPGVIHFRLEKGLHYVTVVFTDTKERQAGKVISLISLFLLLGVSLPRKKLYARP